MPRNHSLPQALTALLLIAALTSCMSQPDTASATSSLQQLLDKAHAASIETRAPYLLDAADLALQQKQLQIAERIGQELSELKLRDEQRARSTMQRARLLLLQGKAEPALTLLQTRQLQQDSAQLSAREQSNLSLLRAQAFAATGKYYASAQERMFVHPLLSESEAKQNHLEIQRALRQLSAAELQQHLSKTSSETVRDWIEPILAEKNKQTSATADRSQKWPTPPVGNWAGAAGGTFQPAQIALLLPLSGKLANFGTAVRDGFFAALYVAKNNNQSVPAVRIYDTEGIGVVALYQQALSDGATLVIGPLEKNLVAQFYAQTLPVPLLALNRAETTQPPPANLYQLALAPEDETAAIAEFAHKDNRSNALIIAGEDEAHSRELEVFSQRWQSQGGTIAATALFHDQQGLSSAIRTALNIPRSEARGKDMEGLLNRNIEFTPHRRHDIDVVFMLAKPTQARLIKPLLDFYYAGDLPIYSTSRIYAGYSVSNADRDAEKVRFTEIPLVLQTSELKQQILTARPASKNFLRLYALGIDCFNLYPHLRQMETASDVRINGQIGMLALDAQRVVQRVLPLAEMRGGVPRVIDSNGTLAQQATDIGNDTGRDGNVDQQTISSP